MKKLLLILVLASLAFGGYSPRPAPVPMGNFTMVIGQTFKGSFDIEDPNGPVGLTITSAPAGLTISEPNITVIVGYPEARRYVYNFSYKPTTTGTKDFTITATDSVGIIAEQHIIFNVTGNAPHVFTGCRGGIGEVSKAWDEFDVTWPIKYANNLSYIQMRTNEEGNIETNVYN